MVKNKSEKLISWLELVLRATGPRVTRFFYSPSSTKPQRLRN